MEETMYDQPTPRADYAGLVRRFIAFFIDLILIAAVCVCIGLLISYLQAWDNEAEIDSSLHLVELIVSFAYFTYFDSEKKGGTPGKQTMSMQVVGEDDQPLLLSKAAIRAVGKIVFGWLPLLWLVPLFTQYRQALHDLLVRSYVMDDSLPKTWQ